MSREVAACLSQSYIRKYDWEDEQDGSTVLFDEDDSNGNGILINLVDYPQP